MMKNKMLSLLILMCFLAAPSTTNAQFFKKLKNKIENKTDEILGSDEDDVQQQTSNGTADNSYNNTNSTDNIVYEPFKRGEIVIFEDGPSEGEKTHEMPSKWREYKSNKNNDFEIVEFEGEKVIRVGEEARISPIVLENEMDYLPDNFTLEFDASFSANSADQRYDIKFFDLKTQNDIVEYEARMVEFELTTFGINDFLTEGTLDNNNLYQEVPNLVWRHISISYKNNNLDFYYDGQHIFRKSNIEGNMIGITLSRTSYSDNNRYLKNIHLATTNN